MLATLLRRLGLVPGLVLILLGLGAAHPALATHLLGGEMTYRYLDANGPAAAPLRYEITVAIYNNCGNSAIRTAASVGIYDQATGSRIVLNNTNYDYTITNSGQTGMMSIPQTSLGACEQPAVPPGCTISGVSQPYQLQKFVGVVNLPMSTAGYYALFTDGNRNVDITNLFNAGGQALTLYTALAPPALPNHSPVFSDLAVAIICANDTTFLLNNAVDADGDRLVYSFGQPYGTVDGLGRLPVFAFAPPPTTLSYNLGNGYSAATPFGTTTGNFAELDANSGIAKYSSTKVGAKYAVAVDVSEYRTVNGQEVLIGTTRRDLQLVVALCPTTKSPVLPPVATMPRNYTIEAGSNLTIPITVTQADGHPLSMTLNSVLLDGAGGYNADLGGQPGTVTPGNPTGTATTTGTNGVVTSTFTFNTACTDARTTPYDVALLVKDMGCAGKTVVDILHITVTKPKGPTAIKGDATVCELNTVHSYVASGSTAAKLSWRVVGGTIVGSSTADTLRVNWAKVGTGSVTVKGISQYGCPLDSVVQRVVVAQPGTLTATGNLTICRGSSTTLTIVGGAAPYTVTGGATPLTGSGPFVVSPTQTTTYTITGAALNSSCGATGQVTVTVNPVPVADAGAATRSTCTGVPISLGAAPVAGLTYSWSPATGLSSSSVANPTLTLPNTTTAAVTQSYTLTVTNAVGCTSTSTVAVTVLPALVPGTIGADQTVCLGSAPAPLTSTAEASGGTGTFAYQWQASADNATWAAVAGATNTTYSPGPVTTLLYYRRVATDACGTVISNVVAVRPQAPVVAGVALPTPAAQCAGTAITFTPVPTNAGTTPSYHWFVNNTLVASSATFTSSTLANGDLVRVELTPTANFCATGQPAATATVSLIPIALPTAAISVRTALPACAGAPVTFRADNVTNLGTGTQYQWQVDGTAVGGVQTTSAGTIFTSSTLRDGQAVSLVVRTTTACGPVTVVSNAITVAINPTPHVEAGPNKTIMEGEQVQLEGSADGTYPVTWAPALGLTIASNPLRPVAAPAVTTTYTLSAQLGDCTGQSSVTVTVTPRLRIPNALSPNGDGNDDTWEIANIGEYPGNHVLVFNRWGNKIFETSGYRRGNEWNGNISGQPAPVGTYYYVITLGNGKSYSGPLTVVY
ncbi:gliding motility-associated C-terminal domain-containing protein [Hymenobacter setariae]|uniref:Gliding motility-associated C-terminal domain-containing protein n=1 Tax=Hymenobacter setariae TaxID=2594794 RepID=A0A558C196_9BACT|nr:gliding motility-associated C-terminal domain-containing protein [Hymenobacter setariae]TVT42555.1 gliding motility-associated C-terminal domain-containing protein [Hymenobacter setariae]